MEFSGKRLMAETGFLDRDAARRDEEKSRVGLLRHLGVHDATLRAWARPGTLLGLVALWWVGARVAASPQLLPGPEQVLVVAWQQCISGDLPRNLTITLWRVAAAFVVAMLVGSVMGYVAGRSRRADSFLDPVAVVALNLPVLVVVVLAYIWIGLNDTAAILSVAIAKAPTVFVTVREGARTLDPKLHELALAYRLPRWRRLRRIELPQLMPYLAALRAQRAFHYLEDSFGSRAFGSSERCRICAEPLFPKFQRRWDPGLRIGFCSDHARSRSDAAAAVGTTGQCMAASCLR
jgi:ABC-type nitrate/sulfonate/bicarbonate transport system permease component